jgi:hypothetical protein
MMGTPVKSPAVGLSTMGMETEALVDYPSLEEMDPSLGTHQLKMGMRSELIANVVTKFSEPLVFDAGTVRSGWVPSVL